MWIVRAAEDVSAACQRVSSTVRVVGGVFCELNCSGAEAMRDLVETMSALGPARIRTTRDRVIRRRGDGEDYGARPSSSSA